MTDAKRKTELRQGAQGRAVHDLGGLDFGPIDRSEHDPALWEKRVDAMLIVLATHKGAFTIDAMRRVIEDYGQQQYDATGYYDKWVRAIRNLLLEQEVVTRPELEAKIAAVREAMRRAGRTVAEEQVPWDR